jgi:hypothetical protein
VLLVGAKGGLDETPGIVEFGLSADMGAFCVILCAKDGELAGFEGCFGVGCVCRWLSLVCTLMTRSVDWGVRTGQTLFGAHVQVVTVLRLRILE